MRGEAGLLLEWKEGLLRRGLESIDFIQAVAVYDHAPCIRRIITQYKYYRRKTLAKDLALLMHANFSTDGSDDSPVFCPVPLHWTRKFQRGFNQSELLARELGVLRSIPVHSLLRRTRPTGHQAWRNREERLTAVQNAFHVHVNTLPKTVILIDDLSTTGSTLNACAAALKKGGVQRVEGWVIALA